MNKATNKQSVPENPSPYEELCGKQLTKEQEAEMKFNLVNVMETFIAMDRQHKEWLKNQKDQPKEEA